MKRRTIWITAAAASAALVLGGTAIAFAATDGFSTGWVSGAETESPDGEGTHLTGSDLEAASAAALDATGPGTVVEAETGDDGTSAYEVEVKLDSGGTVEVRLDDDFAVIDTQSDDRDADSDDGGSNDSDDGESDSD